MARGWESKSVEDQIASAAERAKAESPPLTPKQVETMERVRSLKLSLAYIEQQIAESRSERHKAQLEQARNDVLHQINEETT